MEEFIRQLINEMLHGRDPSPEAVPDSGGARFLRDFLTTGVFGFLQDQARDFQRDPLGTESSASAFEQGAPALGALLAAMGALGVTPPGRASAGFITGASDDFVRRGILDDFLRAGPSADEIVMGAPGQVGGRRGEILEDFLTGGLERDVVNEEMEMLIRDRLLATLLGGR